MRRHFLILTLIVSSCFFYSFSAVADQLEERFIYLPPEEEVFFDDLCQVERESEPGVAEQIFWYIPNRILDLLDIVRLRARVGPGFGAGVRVTKVAQAHLGSHAALYAGFPGPRERRIPKSPIGLECHSGVALSVLELSGGFGFDPGYTATEVGADLHLGIAGLAAGVDPVELADFFSGFFLIDIRNDDFGTASKVSDPVNCYEMKGSTSDRGYTQ